MEQHVYPRTVVSVSQQYTNPTQRAVQEQSGPHHNFTENQLVLAMIQLKNCYIGVKQQSLTHSLTTIKETFYVLVTRLTLFYLVVFIYFSSFMLCFSFNMFKHLECLCCFLLFHKNVYLQIICLYDSIELNKHKFIIATIIISNIKNFHFPFKVLLYQGCLLFCTAYICRRFFRSFLLNAYFLPQFCCYWSMADQKQTYRWPHHLQQAGHPTKYSKP